MDEATFTREVENMLHVGQMEHLRRTVHKLLIHF
jgi:hypothetical protein